MPYTIEQVQTYFDKYFQDKKPKLCKYYDKNIQDYVYFIKNPKYDEVSKADEENYRYVPQKYPYEKMQQTSDLQLRTRVAVSALQSVIKDGKDLSYSDECTIKQRIDINLYSMLWIVELCDSLIKNNKYYCFELIYHYGNLNMEQYMKASKIATDYKYIENPCAIFFETTKMTILDCMTSEGLKKLVCARKLILSEKQQNELYMKNILNWSSPSIDDNRIKCLEVLFKYGAIGLTKQQAKKIAKDFRTKELAPSIASVVTSTFDEVQLLYRNPFEKANDVSKAADKKTQTFVQKENEKIKQQEVEAEDEMDKIFAEAQKNIEMEK
ncbi:MAG: hypothetical protein IJA69_01585 [Clostridia bacterium]|nr:hypothetical protein [Clostridia bacterium]